MRQRRRSISARRWRSMRKRRAPADGLASIAARVAADAFASAMAKGFSALASADYANARTAFEAARKIRPDAPEIAQALRQIEQEQRTGVIAAKLRNAQELEAQGTMGRRAEGISRGRSSSTRRLLAATKVSRASHRGRH